MTFEETLEHARKEERRESGTLREPAHHMPIVELIQKIRRLAKSIAIYPTENAK